MVVQLKPIKTKKIYEEIVEQIKNLIASGNLQPGDRLPSERYLVNIFKVNRASIREALSALEMMGLIEVRSGEGAYISDPDSSLAESFTSLFCLKKDSILDLLEVRKMIEVQAAGYAAIRSTPEDIVSMKNALEIMKKSLNKHDSDREKADLQFHYSIARATQNKITVNLMDTISTNIKQLINVSISNLYENKYTPEMLYQQHVNILNAIMQRDESASQEAMLNHLLGIEVVLLKNLT